MKALFGFAFLISTLVSGLAQAEEMNSPVLIQQQFSDAPATPATINDTLLSTLSFQFITSDLLPGQKMTVQLAEGFAHFDVQRNEAGKLFLTFETGYPEELKNYSIEEIQPDYFELQITAWNVMTYPSAQIRAQMFSGTGQSRQVQFSNRIYPLINITAKSDLPKLAEKSTDVLRMSEWFDILFQGTQVKTGTLIQVGVSFKKPFNNSELAEVVPVVILPTTAYQPELSKQLERAIANWITANAVNIDHGSLVIDFTIVKEAPDGGSVPGYILKGLDLDFTNIAL
ncbi:hypothetical protein DOM22_07310 [Bdellovibrio sp. ZAP7]|uniref:hypothetical protein n=1 Tax=Bdellovibrio sp. ZAP7 TaxID=2231053 RepID=UPI00115A7D05|nr:hypothetical protein [Bdellovibrio sp. ZAP7]QDK44985.1 hypothetical protein DOM22_07310 [Bdellovibrio sp. ZAP7]